MGETSPCRRSQAINAWDGSAKKSVEHLTNSVAYDVASEKVDLMVENK